MASTEQACPSCRSALSLPPEAVARIAAARELLGKKLDAASKLDAAHGRMMHTEGGALLMALLLVLLSCGGLEAFVAVWSAIDKGLDVAWPHSIVPPLGALMATAGIALVLLAIHRGARRRLTRTFVARSASGGAPHGECHACGGALPPVARVGDPSVRCRYCQCDNLLGRDVVVATAVDLGSALAAHAEDMLRSIRRIRLTTMLVGYSGLVLLPAVSIATWVALSWLLQQL